jgi:hypothetical protein
MDESAVPIGAALCVCALLHTLGKMNAGLRKIKFCG